MQKIFIGFIAIMAMYCLMVSSSFAGTIVQTGDTAFTVSSEAVEGTADPLVVDISTHITSYTPSSIPLGTLSDPVINVSLSDSNAVLNALPGLQICVSTLAGAADLVATLASGNGTDSLIFDGAGKSLTNGVDYVFGFNAIADCDTAAGATDILLDVPDGTTSMSLTITAGTAATQVIHDTATLAFLSVVDQYAGTVGTQANNEIDFETDFVDLFGFTTPETATSDTIVIDLAFTALDFGVNDSTTADGADSFSCTVTPSDTTAIDSIHMDANLSGGANPAVGDLADVCTANNSTSWTCTWDDADLTDTDFWIEINVAGDMTIPELTFMVDCELAFGDAAEAEDRTVTNGTPILDDAAAGGWDFRGTSVYVPLIRNNDAGTLETFFKFQSRDEATAANQIRAIVLCDGTGTSITEVVTVGTITAGTPLAWTGTELEALLSGSCTVDSETGYAVILNITSDAIDLFGLVTLVTPNGQQRRIPLSTDQDYTQSDGLTGTISGAGVSNQC